MNTEDKENVNEAFEQLKKDVIMICTIDEPNEFIRLSTNMIKEITLIIELNHKRIIEIDN